MTKRVWLRGGRGALYIGSLIFYWYGTASLNIHISYLINTI